MSDRFDSNAPTSSVLCGFRCGVIGGPSGMQRLVCMFERLFALCPNKRRVSDPSDPDRRCIDDEGECSLCVTPSVLNLWCDLSSLSVCRLIVELISRAFHHGAEVSGH